MLAEVVAPRPRKRAIAFIFAKKCWEKSIRCSLEKILEEKDGIEVRSEFCFLFALVGHCSCFKAYIRIAIDWGAVILSINRRGE
jgi:hypothetical protein